MKNLTRIAERIYNEPWLILRQKHETIQRIYEAHIAGQKVSMPDDMECDDDENDSTPWMEQRTCVIPVYGVLGKHLSGLEMACGGCSVDELVKQIDAAEENYAVKKIVFDFRSPGGNACGVPECGERIASCEKATAAFTDSDCCSGAYWLASQCDIIAVTGSAEIGSVGVYSIYTDRTKQIEDEGIVVNPIVAGQYKVAGAPFKVMSDAERTLLQSQVDYLHAKFQNAILDKREIDPSLLEGQIFFGDQAVANGFADFIVTCIDDMIE